MNAGAKPRIPGPLDTKLLIGLAVAYWVITLFEPWSFPRQSAGISRIAQGVAALGFVSIHGLKRYGWKSMLVWAGLTCAVSWSAETLSIVTGSPFGNYHYSDVMGAKIGLIPWSIMPAYFMTAYFAWTISTILLRDLGSGMKKRNLLLVPVIASFVMVMWDFCFDPILSTVRGAWIWEEGGAYFGVPITNYLGWFLTVFLVFQGFALYLWKSSAKERARLSRSFWFLAPIMYLGIAGEYLLNPFAQTTDLDIYWSMFLAAVMTMVFVSVLAMIGVARLGARHFDPGTDGGGD